MNHEIQLADEGDAEAARKNDTQHQLAAKSYSCNHCDDYTDEDNVQYLAFILNHLKEMSVL